MRRHWIARSTLAMYLATLSTTLVSQEPHRLPVATPDFSAARRLIREGMAKDSVPGVAVAVARGDSVLWEEGFGWADRDRRVPATAQTPFYLASVTKAITATAIMLLREQGLLDLDRPANDYLGAAKLWTPAWDPAGATLRRLLTHTSGLTSFDLACAAPQPHCAMPSDDQIIRRYGVLVQQPGWRFDYSNLGYLVLGDVVARVSGRNFGTFLREEIFLPLGMMYSSLGVDPRLQPQTAIQYSWTRGPIRGPTGPLSGASAAYASAQDLVRFGQLHLEVSRPGVPNLLSQAAIDTMQKSVVSVGGGSQYGLGWWVEQDRFGYRSLLAQGGTDASSAWLRLVPSESISVAVLANRGVGFPGDVVEAVLGALLPRYAALRAAQEAGGGSSAPPTTRPDLDTAIVGDWHGIVWAETARVPFAIALAASGALRGTLGSRVGEVSGSAHVCCGGQLLRISIPGGLTTQDSSGGRRLTFYLRPRGRLLTGHVTTRPSPASGLDGLVSYWVELGKQR